MKWTQNNNKTTYNEIPVKYFSSIFSLQISYTIYRALARPALIRERNRSVYYSHLFFFSSLALSLSFPSFVAYILKYEWIIKHEQIDIQIKWDTFNVLLFVYFIPVIPSQFWMYECRQKKISEWTNEPIEMVHVRVRYFRVLCIDVHVCLCAYLNRDLLPWFRL